MCLILFAFKSHPNYKLIVAANRDEFYNRKTAPAEYWEDHPGVLAGRDLEGMGTWMGMHTDGNVSMLTNYRDLANIKPAAPTRGKLVSNFLITKSRPSDYLDSIHPLSKSYNDYNLVLGTPDDLWYYSNVDRRKIMLGSGVYGLSNHLLDTAWPKVEMGKSQLHEAIGKENVNTEDLFRSLRSDHQAPDNQLPETGVGIEMERMLSPMFIKSPKYGTRCSTVLTVDNQNKVCYIERSYDTRTFQYTDRKFDFVIH